MVPTKEMTSFVPVSPQEIIEDVHECYELGITIAHLHARNEDLAYPNMREKHQYLLAAGMKKLGDGSWAKARKVCGLHVNFRLSDEKIKAWEKANG